VACLTYFPFPLLPPSRRLERLPVVPSWADGQRVNGARQLRSGVDVKAGAGWGIGGNRQKQNKI